MKRSIFGIAALVFLASAGAQAAQYHILNTSVLNDVRRVGGANIPEIAQFSTCIPPSVCSGSLNPLDPTSWPLLDATIATYPYADPANPSIPVGIELNDINVYGSISVVAGSVTAATIKQCDNTPGSGSKGFCSHIDPLSFGTFQTATTTSDVVSGDVSLMNCDHISGGSANAKCVLSNALVWTYNPGTNQLNHQAGGGTALTSSSIATCVVVAGGPTGSCRQLAAWIDASGELGGGSGGSIASSVWNWNGMAANYIVRDGQTTPWHTATGTSSTGGLQVSGAAGHAGVVWDLSGFVDGVGGIITARVVSDALSGGNATGTSALYTLQVAAVPVPAAVWLFASGLGLLGWLRRRGAAA
ncbi:MAG: hypothetical protein QY320_00590 [Gammaproteobacteria bacterium]|nr:MAG: hypothetical protein QY320_00590 [Gammaproteobacteria bacterium]